MFKIAISTNHLQPEDGFASVWVTHLVTGRIRDLPIANLTGITTGHLSAMDVE